MASLSGGDFSRCLPTPSLSLRRTYPRIFQDHDQCLSTRQNMGEDPSPYPYIPTIDYLIHLFRAGVGRTAESTYGTVFSGYWPEVHYIAKLCTSTGRKTRSGFVDLGESRHSATEWRTKWRQNLRNFYVQKCSSPDSVKGLPGTRKSRLPNIPFPRSHESDGKGPRGVLLRPVPHS